MAKQSDSRRSRIFAAVEHLMEETPRAIEMPGGEARASCRVILKNQTVIATKRPNFRRTRLEASVLKALAPACPCVPEFIGYHDDVLLQADVGGTRLSQAIWQKSDIEQNQLARDAVQGIFAIHTAAKENLRDVPVPPLGSSPAWVDRLFTAADILAGYDAQRVSMLNKGALADVLKQPPRQFLKWDCRAGNAAIGAEGQLRWFDFEYCGMRHGAEDFAWLIGDESWPVPAEDMFALIEAELMSAGRNDVPEYMHYLAVFSTFHILQRLALVIDEVERRGWRSMRKIIERDDVGRHPVFAASLCRNGMFCSAQSPLTQPLRRGFKRAADWYEKKARQLPSQPPMMSG